MGSYYDNDWNEWRLDDEFDHRDRETQHERRECFMHIRLPDEDGQCRFFLAPCVDGSWNCWGEWHGLDPGEESTDALYDFIEGGAYFATREEGIAEALKWVEEALAHAREKFPLLAYEI